MRVHELAKATQLESKEVIAIAKKHRIAIKPSPSANVEDKDIRKMMPYIDKYKSETRLRDEEDRKRKEEERTRKDEERRKKDEVRRLEADTKRKVDEVERAKADVEAKAEARKQAEDARRRRDEEKKLQRDEESRRRAEDERLRSLGMPVPKRPAGFRPRIAPPTPTPPPTPPPVSPAPRVAAPRTAAPATGQPQGIRPGAGTPRPAGQQPGVQGQAQAPRAPGQGIRPGGGTSGMQRPGGPPRPAQPGNPGQRPPYQGQGGQGQSQRPPYQGQGGQGQGQRPPYQGGQGQGQRPPYQGQGGQGQGQRPPFQGQGGQGQRPPYQGGQPQQRVNGGFRPGQPGSPGFQRPRPGGGPGGPGGQRPQGGPGSQQGGFRRPDGQQGQRPRSDRPAQLSESNLPTIGVMRLDKPVSRRVDKDKKPADKKRGKVAPRKIFELDEDMTVTTRPKPQVAQRAAPGGMMGGRFGSRRMGSRKSKKGGGAYASAASRSTEPRQVVIEGPITVSQFADKIGIQPTEIIKKVLLDMGEALSMNAVLSEEYIQLLAPEFNVELEIIPVGDEYDIAPYLEPDKPENMQRRPPVVTIMGHVDHGKTSLLDRVRKSDVVGGEFGGITQHIGAYHVSTAKGDIVFLDTPGHEAFTSMRARGAGITDLVILVVAANDGFKPQTIEAVHHAQAAKVPIVVAVNKIDLPGADPDKVRQEALQHNLIPEEFGGETIFVNISAKQGTNVDQLLEMVALQSEILDLKADPEKRAVGTIIESHIDPTRGAVATVLIQSGTLRNNDSFVTGDISGRVRAMNNDRGKSIKEAGPAFPAEIIGLSGSPAAGETFFVMPDEQSARKIAEAREFRRRAAGLNPTTQKHITLEHLHEFIEEGKTKELDLIIKADVQGSIEAVVQSLEKLSNDQIRIRVLHSAVGGINESDVNLAAASDAIIIGFNVRPEQHAQDQAAQEGVEIKLYRIIYDLIEEVKAAMLGMLSPTFREKVIGHAEVRQIFRASRIGTIAGSYVKDGELIRDAKCRVVRDSVVVYEGNLGSLRRIKEDVKKVAAGMECGITVENYNDIKEGDIVEAYQIESVAPVLNVNTSPVAAS